MRELWKQGFYLSLYLELIFLFSFLSSQNDRFLLSWSIAIMVLSVYK